MHGTGTYTYSSTGSWVGDKYVGEFKEERKHGQGTYTWADGGKYVGEFKHGKIYGKGTYTYADGRIQEGIWKDDELIYAQKITPSSKPKPQDIAKITPKKLKPKGRSTPPQSGSGSGL